MEEISARAPSTGELLVLDDTAYLHVQPCDTGWDYTLYDVATMKQLDGGRLDGPDLGRSAAVSHICEDMGMGGKSIKYAPLSMIETLQRPPTSRPQKLSPPSCRMPRSRRWTSIPCRARH